MNDAEATNTAAHTADTPQLLLEHHLNVTVTLNIPRFTV